jgi:hypothetical protein
MFSIFADFALWQCLSADFQQVIAEEAPAATMRMYSCRIHWLRCMMSVIITDDQYPQIEMFLMCRAGSTVG